MFAKHKTPVIAPQSPEIVNQSAVFVWPFVYAHGELEKYFAYELEYDEAHHVAPDLVCADTPVPELEGIHVGMYGGEEVHIFLAIGPCGQMGGRVCYPDDKPAWDHCLKWYESQKFLQRKTSVSN